MRTTRIRSIQLAALAGALLAACANQPKKLQTGTDVTDAPVAAAPAEAAEPARGGCGGDADCAAGQVCTSGQCVEPPRCDLLRVSFAFDSAQLDERATQSLRDSARCLQDRRTTSLLVEGHCDERGTTGYNIALGAKRAESVKRYLAELGVTAKIDTVSFGKELPAEQGTGEAAWAKNRRAELRSAGDTRSDGKVFAPGRS